MNINPEKIDRLVNIFINMDEDGQDDVLKNAAIIQENTRLKNEVLRQDNNGKLAGRELEMEITRRKKESKQDAIEMVKQMQQIRKTKGDSEVIDHMAAIYIEMLNLKRELLTDYSVKIEVVKKSRNVREAVQEIFPTVNYKHAVELWKTSRSSSSDKVMIEIE